MFVQASPALLESGINIIWGQVRIAFPWRKKPVLAECPLQLRGGLIDADEIGAFSYFGEGNSHLEHIGRIGRFCAFGPHLVTGNVEHAVTSLTPHPMFTWEFDRNWKAAQELYDEPGFIAALHQKEMSVSKRQEKIEIGNDVWIGNGVYISRGVTIGDGAVIAARAVVTHDVPPYTVVGGVPAKVIRQRFSDDIVARLLELRWWRFGPLILKGVDITDMDTAIVEIERRVQDGFPLYVADKVEFDVQQNAVFRIAAADGARTLLDGCVRAG